MSDKFDEQAERLLPCTEHCGGGSHVYLIGGVCCPAIFRPAVAAALLEAERRRNRYQADAESWREKCADLRAEVDRLKSGKFR